MHSQNCNFLPNKRQTTFNSSFPCHIGMLRNLSSQSFANIDSSTLIDLNTKPAFKVFNQNHSSKRPASVMDFVYSFNSSSSIKLRESLSTTSIPIEKPRQHCKQIISQYNTVTHSMPFLSSHLVGGFVGSKSQLGRRPTHGFGVNMWDIVRELMGVFGNSPADLAGKGSMKKNSSMSKKCSNIAKGKDEENQINMSENNMVVNCCKTKVIDAQDSQKQSYADVTKTTSALRLEEKIIHVKTDDQEESSIVCNSFSNCNFFISSGNDNRDRITSECSVDSEDSFVVFENSEGDDVSIDDDDCSTGDDESLLDFEIINKESCTGSDSSLDTTCCLKDNKSTKKKVQFAEGKDLAVVHPMITWNYAYRAARRGPWEMLARDAERFRWRIANTEAILSPILDPDHRKAVFKQRFTA